MKDDELGRVYSEGEIIFREGEEADRMYVIQSGKVTITKRTDSGDLAIATLGNGEIFGEMALFDRLPRSATAIASHEARLLGIDKKKLFQMISRDPTMVFKIIESMSSRIRRLDQEFAKLRKNRTDVLHLFTDLEETCRFILDEIKNCIPADNGSIMLLDDRKESLSIQAAFGTQWNPKTRLHLGEGIAGDVLKTGKAELVNNVSLDQRFKSGAAHITSVLCVPLKYQGDCFGVINMSKSSENLFTLDDLKRLHSMSIPISVAINNVRRFYELKKMTEELLRHATILSL